MGCEWLLLGHNWMTVLGQPCRFTLDLSQILFSIIMWSQIQRSSSEAVLQIWFVRAGALPIYLLLFSISSRYLSGCLLCKRGCRFVVQLSIYCIVHAGNRKIVVCDLRWEWAWQELNHVWPVTAQREHDCAVSATELFWLLFWIVFSIYHGSRDVSMWRCLRNDAR